MEEQNNKNSIFENSVPEGVTIEENAEAEVNVNPKPTIVEPVKAQRDLGDKTIDAVENFINTADHAREYSPEEIKKYKTSAIICYIPLAVLYFVLTKKHKESKYLTFHANQGLNTTLIWIGAVVISATLKAKFTRESM